MSEVQRVCHVNLGHVVHFEYGHQFACVSIESIQLSVSLAPPDKL